MKYFITEDLDTFRNYKVVEILSDNSELTLFSGTKENCIILLNSLK